MPKQKILYVDDEAANLFNFSVAFREHYRVLTALSGEEAMDMFRENPDVAIVVVDQRMPGMSGVELLSRVMECNQDVVRIILTAYTEVSDIIDSINKGQIFHYIVKPWDEQELLNLFKKAVGIHHLQTENRRLLRELDEKNRTLEADIAKRKKVESILLRRDMVLAAVNNMAHALLLEKDWRLHIESLMGRMGLVMGLSRIQIVSHHVDESGDMVACPEFIWVAGEGVPLEFLEKSLPAKISYEKLGFSRWYTAFADNEIVFGDVETFPLSERDFLNHHNIRSIALAPIIAGNSVWGVIGFEDCIEKRSWPTPELDALHTAANLIGTAIAREKAESDLATQQVQLTHAGRLTALGEMASGIGHEIHQPLTVINLGAETCKSYFNRQDPRCPAAEAAEEIRVHVKKITNIINSMRSFSRASSGEWRKISLTRPLQEALTFFREQFRMNGIEYEENISNDLPLVKTDGQKFEQIVVNFLSNARYAVDRKNEKTPDAGKKVSVSLRYENLTKEELERLSFKKDDTISNQVIVFQVKDNGIGMNHETTRRCLEPFFTTKEVGEGTGLGLSVTMGIIRELNFHLEIESREGEGATFRVLIPVAGEDCI